MSKQPEPSEPLQVHVDWWVGRGWQIVSQTVNSAKLKNPPGPLARLYYLLAGDVSKPSADTLECYLYLKDGLVRKL